jgi:hypothetical protein
VPAPGYVGPAHLHAVGNTQALVHTQVDGQYRPGDPEQMNSQAQVDSTAHFVRTKFPG